MKIGKDGSVTQSTLSSQGSTPASQVYRMDFALKKGVVTQIYYTEDPNNKTKQFIEYDVVVIEERADGGNSTVTYSRCQTMDRFGTSNNFEHYTLQPNVKKDGANYTKGAQVLLLAINGNASGGRGIIVGGISYPHTKKATKDDGQFYEWQFNGINVKVDKDGQYIMTFNSPIDVDGKKKDSKAAGTTFQIFKDGKLKISDNEKQSWEIDRVNQKSTWGNGADSIVIDKKNKKIDLTSTGTTSETIAKSKDVNIKEKDHSVTTKAGSINENSGKDINEKAKANIVNKAGANWTINAGGNATINAGGNLTMTGGGTAQLKGTLNLIGDGNVPAAGVGISQCMGTGNAGYPVFSQILTGSATVLIGS